MLKYTVHAMTPPTYHHELWEHCCDCEHCWEGPESKECPYTVPQVCMLCNEKSTLALLLDREIDSDPEEIGVRRFGYAKFWACDKHVSDEKLLNVLRVGVPTTLARSKPKLISYVRKRMEEFSQNKL